jgi:antitoxin PrlF
MRSSEKSSTPSVPNAFSPSFLQTFLERDEPPTAAEADLAGPWLIEEIPGRGFGNNELQGRAAASRRACYSPGITRGENMATHTLRDEGLTDTVRDKGLITLPDEVREHLHLKAGDRVEFVIEPGGKVYLHPVSPQDLFGLLHGPDIAPRTVEEIREGMIESLSEDNERIKRGG